MNSHFASPKEKPQRSRFAFVVFVACSLILTWTGLRLLLYLNFTAHNLAWEQLGRVLLRGLHYDATLALLCVLPLTAWFALVPERWMVARWHRFIVWTTSFLLAWAVAASVVLEYQFFAEFQSRWNSLPLDVRALPPREWWHVATSYAFVWWFPVCGLVALTWTAIAKRMHTEMWLKTAGGFNRAIWLLFVLALLAGLLPTLKFRGVRLGADRAMNEIAGHGWVSLAHAAWMRRNDFASQYQTIPPDEAFARVRRLVAATNSTFIGEGRSLTRQVEGDANRPRLNVVLIVAESFESAFWGSLGHANKLTPEMDPLVSTNALVFDNVYATGNRTGLGLEGLLASRPPLPRVANALLPGAARADSLAEVLERDGYETVFLCGGNGEFDGARAFALKHGFARFKGQPEMSGALFRTEWGVSDEDLLTYTLNECRELHAQRKPFLAVVQTVSNQRPYKFPAKVVAGQKPERTRSRAVRYADRALARFFEAVRQEAYWTNTLFAMVANHGASVRGNTQLPFTSHAIPFLVMGPAVVSKPARVMTLGSSLDVSPTLLGLLGRPYQSEFLGRDLTRVPHREGRAPLRHGFDIGVLSNERLVVLHPGKTISFYSGNPRSSTAATIANPAGEDEEFQRDALALFRVALELQTDRVAP